MRTDGVENISLELAWFCWVQANITNWLFPHTKLGKKGWSKINLDFSKMFWSSCNQESHWDNGDEFLAQDDDMLDGD